MAEYIKREDALQVIEDAPPCIVKGCNRCEAEYLNEQGVTVRVFGRWKKVSDKSPRYSCSVCNHLYNNKGYKFCPCCGAKMI